MAVFRVEKTRDYTIMSNYHLKEKNLTLKAKGLLSVILSLPDKWNYSTRGLAAICKEGVDSHRRRAAGTGGRRIHPAPQAAGRKRQDHGYRVCHL